MLKYLYIERFEDTWWVNDESYGLYVKELVIKNSSVNFKIFELLLKQTPNLNILTITVHYELDILMLDVKGTINLIFITSLIYFQFSILYCD